MKHVAVSVRARLLNYSKQSGIPFQNLLDEFALGRFLWRLSRSRFQKDYILKGAQLFRLWGTTRHRPTRDLDLLGHGPPDEQTLHSHFTEVLGVPSEPPDGLIWEAVETGPIRRELKHGGVHAILRGSLDGARVSVQVDVGFGDAVSPAPDQREWSGLIGFSSAELLVYPPETVIAEKLEAAVVLGIGNSRMKDFFDLDWLCRHMEFERSTLHAAITATFTRRGTAWPEETPLALTAAFGEERSKQTQWSAFLRKSRLTADPLPVIIGRLHGFLHPVLFSNGENSAMKWSPAAGWHTQS